jgi:hypothetical protein
MCAWGQAQANDTKGKRYEILCVVGDIYTKGCFV